MNEKEFNGLILAELVKIANDVFTNEIEIAPGTYTAAELAKLKDANGNEINIKYLCVDAKLNITDFRTVQINSFKCSFPVDQVFNLVWQFEKLIGTKQANKTRFTKIEERENIVCSFDMWITKEHLNITKLVTKDSLRPAFNYIYLDPYKSALVASDGRTLKEYPVIIETSGLLPDGLKLFINPKHLKEMVGRCSVCVCSQEGGNITEITNDKKQTFICDFAGYFPNYRLVYPNLSKDGFYQDQINKALQRLTMLTELSGISLPELLTEPVSEETNANVPEPITEDEPVRAYTPELLYIDRPLVFPVPIFIHKHERTISRIVVPELLNHQCIALLFVSMMLPELLRRYVWGTIRPKANADELFWGDFRRFHTKGNHRIRDGTKEANKPKL
nr:hypothetical protein [Bacteroides intestinalis]